MRRFSLLVSLAGLLGCAQILDIEERKGTDEGAGEVQGTDSALCQQYCGDVDRTCTRERNAAQFETKEACLGLCRAYDVGDPKTPSGNTLACRIDKLAIAARDGEFATSCAPAGPGGQSADPADTAGSCGTNCESYCTIYARTCTPIADCVNRCKALPDVGAADAHASYTSNSDTLQCRLAHVGAAASAKRAGDLKTAEAHCGHSGIQPTSQCTVADTATHPYDCNDYCKLVTNACTGANAVYENEAQCLAVCTKGKLEVGKAADLQANTLLCRRENGYLALQGSAAANCTNAGPAPGRCGQDKCDSYCALAAAGCPTQFTANFPGDAAIAQQTCQAQCRNEGPNKIGGSGANGTYSVNSDDANKGRSMSCRIKHISRVFGESNTGFCDAVFGGLPCRDP